MPYVMSMPLAGPTGHEEGERSGRRIDPVRRIVQGVLVAYLSPVILVVLILGGLCVAGSRVIAAVEHFASRQ